MSTVNDSFRTYAGRLFDPDYQEQERDRFLQIVKATDFTALVHQFADEVRQEILRLGEAEDLAQSVQDLILGCLEGNYPADALEAIGITLRSYNLRSEPLLETDEGNPVYIGSYVMSATIGPAYKSPYCMFYFNCPKAYALDLVRENDPSHNYKDFSAEDDDNIPKSVLRMIRGQKRRGSRSMTGPARYVA